ncbi:Csu type fimbrial protein [Vibrio parahaemolyticus]|uniref:Csu type fimbrial protein n=1 Tax=Vibrio parahaemolyticus TaxID=670 RepID=UPI001EEB078C|nr:spore coat U domain-containing protein [Vibrio parahaemolyticus]MCG6444338.1 spore coat U domain-containing protein [Vibrio parahaemolyticus]MCG6457733.1 spore coat U domain-containing protein [Vibrio parahaemolyticus]
MTLVVRGFSLVVMSCCSSTVLADVTETFQVSATVDTGCLINGAVQEESATQVGQIGTLDFGEHSSVYAAEVQGSVTYSSSLTLSCTPGIAMNVSLNGGLNSSDGVRKLKHSEEVTTVDYFLFQDLDYTQVLDIDTRYSVDTTQDPDNIQFPIWAKAIINGNEMAGIYMDTLTLTLEW